MLSKVEKIYYLLSALQFTVGKNYQRISLAAMGKKTVVRFEIEMQNDVDPQFIQETMEDYEDWIDQASSYAETVQHEIIVGHQTHLDEKWEIVYKKATLRPVAPSISDSKIRFSFYRALNISQIEQGNAGRKEMVSFTMLAEHVVILNDSFCGNIWWNFRAVILGLKQDFILIRVVLEQESESDIDAIKRSVMNYERRVNDQNIMIEVEIYIDQEKFPTDNPFPEMRWFTVYARRTFFEEFKETWDSIESFSTLAEFHRFQEDISEMLRMGIIEAIPVQKYLSTKTVNSEKWFLRKKTGDVWRLIPYNQENEGQFALVL